MTSTESYEERARALDVLRRSERLVLVGHVRPDGDCVGAQAALASGLSSLGKTVHIVNPDPPAEEFDYLSRQCSYGVFDGQLPAHDVVVLLDFNELSRSGAMEASIVGSSATKVVIDHHPPGERVWWDAAYVDVSAAATGVLVWRILGELGADLDATGAAGVFTSIVTDTGWFRYSNTNAETLDIAAEMARRGVDPATIHAAVLQRNPSDEPEVIARLLERTEYFAEGRLAVVDSSDAGSTAFRRGSDVVLDILRSVEAVEVVLLLHEVRPGVCKLSARSKSDIDVNALARRFGGGGHARASGATISGKLSDVRARLVAAALEALHDA